MMTATTERAKGASPEAHIPGENGARAGLYAVLSHLFAAQPSAALLQHIAEAGELIAEGSTLGDAWQALVQAASTADPAAVATEYDALFVSPGLPPVSLYASSYMAGRERGQLLAELRGLIGEEASADDAGARQQAFFGHYIAPWHARLSASVAASGDAAFYRTVLRFADAFFAHESAYFELA